MLLAWQSRMPATAKAAADIDWQDYHRPAPGKTLLHV